MHDGSYCINSLFLKVIFDVNITVWVYEGLSLCWKTSHDYESQCVTVNESLSAVSHSCDFSTQRFN